jgi:hypothetical protein
VAFSPITSSSHLPSFLFISHFHSNPLKSRISPFSPSIAYTSRSQWPRAPSKRSRVRQAQVTFFAHSQRPLPPSTRPSTFSPPPPPRRPMTAPRSPKPSSDSTPPSTDCRPVHANARTATRTRSAPTGSTRKVRKVYTSAHPGVNLWNLALAAHGDMSPDSVEADLLLLAHGKPSPMCRANCQSSTRPSSSSRRQPTLRLGRVHVR